MSLRINTKKTVIVSSNPQSLPPSQDTQVLTNVNGTNIFSYPGYNYKGSNMFPGFPNAGSVNQNDVSFGSYTSFTKYWGGALAPNGNIYFVPYLEQTVPANYVPNVGIFNPYTRTFDTTTISRTNYPDISNLTNSQQFAGAVTGPNGRIYCIPARSPFVGIINPQTNTFDSTTITGINPTGAFLYKGGVLAPNGKIYCAPGSFTDISIGVIDTVTNTFSTLAVPQPVPGTGGYGWYGGALGRNGCIYFAPHRDSGGRPMKVDPFTNTVTHIDPSSPTLLGSTYGAVTGKDGNVYIMPFANSGVVRIDVSNDTFRTVAGTRPYNVQGGIIGQDGLIYMVPGESNIANVAAFNTDTSTNTILTNCLVNVPGGSDQNPYIGAVMGPDGKIYFAPSKSGTIVSVETGIPSQQPWMLAPEFNKF